MLKSYKKCQKCLVLDVNVVKQQLLKLIVKIKQFWNLILFPVYGLTTFIF